MPSGGVMSELIHCAFPFCLDFTTDEREPWYCVKHTDAGPLLVALNARIADLERQLAACAAGPWSTDMGAAPRGVDLLARTDGNDGKYSYTPTCREDWEGAEDLWRKFFDAWAELRTPKGGGE